VWQVGLSLLAGFVVFGVWSFVASLITAPHSSARRICVVIGLLALVVIIGVGVARAFRGQNESSPPDLTQEASRAKPESPLELALRWLGLSRTSRSPRAEASDAPLVAAFGVLAVAGLILALFAAGTLWHLGIAMFFVLGGAALGTWMRRRAARRRRRPL
jgi:Flp pilus assembly protein TadB